MFRLLVYKKQPEKYKELIMWHIVAIGYIFVTFMFAIAQGSLARILIYLVFWTILPTVFAFWVAITRRRNKMMKQQELLEHQQKYGQKQPENPQ